MPDTITDRDILNLHQKAYELYMQRCTQETNLIWSRFKIYLTINAGIVAGMTFLLKEVNFAFSQVPPWLWLLFGFASLAGWNISKAMKASNIDGMKWQLFFNKKLAELEHELPSQHVRLYTDVMIEYKNLKKETDDAGDTGTQVANIFCKLWLATIAASIVFFFYSTFYLVNQVLN